MRPHSDGLSRISFILSGQLEESTSKESVQSSSMAMVFKNPNVIHSNKFGQNGCKIFSLVFNDDEVIDTFGTHFPVWKWDNSTDSFVLGMKLLEAYHSSSSDQTEDILLNHRFEVSDDKISSEVPALVRRCVEMMYDGRKATLKIKEMAHEMNTHPVYLARVFRKFMGCSPKDFQALIKVKFAATELQNRSLNLSQLAIQSGFVDLSHFSKALRKTLNQRPEQFKMLLS